MSIHKGVGKAWGELGVVNMSDHMRKVADQALIADRVPSHTNSGSSWGGYPLVDCSRDNAIASGEASLRLASAVALLPSLHLLTTS